MAKKVDYYKGAEIWRNDYRKNGKGFVGTIIFPKRGFYRNEELIKASNMTMALKKAKLWVDKK